MEVRYLALYRLFGFSKIFDDVETLDLISLEKPTVLAKLTTNPEYFCVHIDRYIALANQLLKGLLGQNGTLETEIINVQTERRKRTAGGVYLAIEGTDDVADPNLKLRRDMGEFSVCFDAYSKMQLREKFRPYIHNVMLSAQFLLAENASSRTEKIGEVSFLIEPPSNKVIYSFTPNISGGTISVATPVPQIDAQRVQQIIRKMISDNAMSKVCDLLIHSQEAQVDNFRSFTSAWTALEIFINMFFKSTYEEKWLLVLSSNAPDSAAPYFKRLKEVMTDKYRLKDKFTIISSILDSNNSVQDCVSFTKLKVIRDEVFHAVSADATHYPTEEIRRLLRKYIYLHLQVD